MSEKKSPVTRSSSRKAQLTLKKPTGGRENVDIDAITGEEVTPVLTPKREKVRVKSRTKTSSSHSKVVGSSTSSSSSSSSLSSLPSSDDNDFHYEFGGPLGAFGVIVGLPLVIYLLYFACNKSYCLDSSFSNVSGAIEYISASFEFSSLWSTEALVMYTSWMIFNVFLERVLPGEAVSGVALPDPTATPLRYTMSGKQDNK